MLYQLSYASDVKRGKNNKRGMRIARGGKFSEHAGGQPVWKGGACFQPFPFLISFGFYDLQFPSKFSAALAFSTENPRHRLKSRERFLYSCRKSVKIAPTR
jgi:hypothetical protein